MGGIGIVSNPLARLNQLHPGTGRQLRRLLGDEGLLVEATTREGLASALARFHRMGVDLLAVNGGDGTGHLVLTAAVSQWGEAPLPPVLLLRAGAMNTVAEAHGLRGSPQAALQRLLERRRRGAPLSTVERDLLAARADEGPVTHGFLLGTGVIVAFLDGYYRSSLPGRSAAAGLLAHAVLSAMVGGRLAAGLRARERRRVVADGDEWPDLPYLAVLAGTIPEIGFGFTPFSRCDEQPGFFHAVGVTGSTLQVALHLPSIWWGRPWRRRLAVDGIARELLVEGPTRFTVDGDLYEAREELRVTTGPAVKLVVF